MKKPLLVLATFLSLAGCGVTEFSAPGQARSTSVPLAQQDSAVMAFADSLASSPATAKRPPRTLHLRRGPALLHTH
jgi:hypothetical protein